MPGSTIRFACKCGTKIEVPHYYAGQQGRCPACSAVVQVPQTDTLPAGQGTSADSGAATTDAAVPARPRGPYASTSFAVCLVLLVIAAMACLAVLLLPWTQVPQPPETGQLADLRALLTGKAGLSEVAAAVPREHLKLAVLPAGLVLLSFIGLFMPRYWLRGGVILAAAGTVGICWFVAVAWLRGELLLQTPLARYVSNPGLFADFHPGAATLGPAVWVLLAAGGLVLVTAAVNLGRSLPGVLLTLGLPILVTAFGLLHLEDWLRSQTPQVTLTVSTLVPPVSDGGVFGTQASAEAVLALTNQGRRPVVLVPAWGPGDGGPGVPDTALGTKPGQWVEARGKPDLRLDLLRGADHSEALATGARERRTDSAVPLRFGSEREHGVVLRPGGRVLIAAQFEPAWEQQPWRAGTRAGPWTLRVSDPAGLAVSTLQFEVPGVLHPDDAEIEGQYRKFEAAHAKAEDVLARLREDLDGLRRRNPRLRSIVRRLGEAGAAIAKCHASMEALSPFGVEVPVELQESLAEMEASAEPETVALLNALFDDLEQQDVPTAAQKLAQLVVPQAQRGELLEEICARLPRWALDRAQERAAGKHYRDTVALLAALENADPIDLDLQEKAQELLTEAVHTQRRAGAVSLVQPNGDVGLAPEWGVELAGAWRQALRWDPNFAQKHKLEYMTLLLKQRSGNLEQQDVHDFLFTYPDTEIHAEALCWLGLRMLEADKRFQAREYFSQVLQLDEAAGAYLPLAHVGIATLDLRECEDDAYLRTLAEHRIFSRLQGRLDWTDSLRRLTGAQATRIEETDWATRLTLINSSTELQTWVAGPRDTIPWLRFEVPRALDSEFDALREYVHAGTVALVSSRAIERFNFHDERLRPQRAPASVKRGRAQPMPEATLLAGIDAVDYDLGSAEWALPYTSTVIDCPRNEPLLLGNSEYLVSLARSHGRGKVVFLPERILDTPAGRRFLRILVETYSAPANP